MKILALIPARSGSKSIQHKNIASINGKPLLAYSIEHARQSTLISRTIVSTDSEYYAEIARSFGAETPFLRPVEISGDLSTDLEAFQHALKWLREEEGFIPEICVHLRPSCPVRTIKDIDSMIKLLIENPEADAVRSITPAEQTPFKMWYINENNRLTPVIENESYPEAYNMPRQALPKAFIQNAAIDVIRTSTITEKNSMTGENILGYVMDEMVDIDYHHELEAASTKMSSVFNDEKKTFCFDIDGVIAHLSPNNQYDLAQPNDKIITKVNELYNKGHRIVLCTARGTKTGIDWQQVTANQMKKWGVSYHELLFGKPAADYYIDDRNLDMSKL